MKKRKSNKTSNTWSCNNYQVFLALLMLHPRFPREKWVLPCLASLLLRFVSVFGRELKDVRGHARQSSSHPRVCGSLTLLPLYTSAPALNFLICSQRRQFVSLKCVSNQGWVHIVSIGLSLQFALRLKWTCNRPRLHLRWNSSGVVSLFTNYFST